MYYFPRPLVGGTDLVQSFTKCSERCAMLTIEEWSDGLMIIIATVQYAASLMGFQA